MLMLEANGMTQTGSEAEKTLRSLCASMNMEGFRVSQQTQKDCRDVLSGKQSADKLVAAYIRQYGNVK